VEKVKRSWFGILKGLKSFSKKKELKGRWEKENDEICNRCLCVDRISDWQQGWREG
jgi:hypothetical protein